MRTNGNSITRSSLAAILALVTLANGAAARTAATRTDAVLVNAFASVGTAGSRRTDDGVPGLFNALQSIPVLSHHAYLKASNAEEGDYFGYSIAIDGDTLVVGAAGEDNPDPLTDDRPDANTAQNAGAVYVFRLTGGVWTQEAYLKASNADAADLFGWSVAIDGDIIVVGVPNEDSSGAPGDNTLSDAGAAYVYERVDGEWHEDAYLKAWTPDGSDRFGWSVGVSGNKIVVGAPLEDSNGDQEADNSMSDAGAAYAFNRATNDWEPAGFIKAPTPVQAANFGVSVAMTDDTMVIGAAMDLVLPAGAVDPVQAGSAYVFSFAYDAWVAEARLTASQPDHFDFFGSSVAIDGDTVLVSSPLEDSAATGVNGNEADNNADGAGAAFAFVRADGSWPQQAYMKASNAHAGQRFGASVAIHGDRAVIGASRDASIATGVNGDPDDTSSVDAGAAYALTRTGATWSHHAYLKASNTDAGDNFGDPVAISDTTIAVAAVEEDSAATGIDGDEQDDNAPDAGAVHVYGPSCSVAPFSDVPTMHTFCAEIEWMAQTGVSRGFDDGAYRPAANVTRQAMSAFLARFDTAALNECATQPFSDVEVTHPFCEEILWMKDNGISTGFSDGTYKPTQTVTRQAMSAFLARMTGAKPPACTAAPFSDVPEGHPFCKEIQWMKDNGISTGFSDGTYRPDANVSRQAMSAFLYRLRVLQL